ncbi:transcription termination/antitermination protein NusA [Salinisphaera sp. USBA-960]|uniref:transcription termination factor NusA n=1 Tax=Salinisphaera orenii TaxID=856731 RepID=UPI000DBE7C3A|nr:transcription termination/antitermination protein NusA [Salifodinibacter halophilus]NNC25538.1 transcription termination/antitermination protein NusA [Salifodinibacter halophilus]
MSKNVLLVAEAVANEKGVERPIIFEAIEAALESATRKLYDEDVGIRVTIDQDTGDYRTFRFWEVLEPGEIDAETGEPRFIESPGREISVEQAHEHDTTLSVGDVVEEEVESIEFGRIGAQAAKQVIVQKVREAERAQIVEQYRDRVGELITGLVKRLDKGSVILDLGGNAEALIPRDHLIPRETMRPGDRVRGFLFDVRPEQRGPQLFVSRTRPEFLVELFKLEVPEVGQGLIELRGAARDPGLRAKISVQAKDRRIDPVGACVGMRGSRVQSVSNELVGERIDIIVWDENPAQFVINAMAPADIESIVLDEDSGSMDLAVTEESLAKAIGRGGQNIRLASNLTEWQLNVMTLEDADAKSESESRELQEHFQTDLDVDAEVAAILVQEGFTTTEEVAYVPPSELLTVEEFDEDVVEELRNRARDCLLSRAISSAEGAGEGEPADSLLQVDGIDDNLGRELAGHGVQTRDDLAELDVEELQEYIEIDNERAAALIMAARAHWFEATDS